MCVRDVIAERHGVCLLCQVGLSLRGLILSSWGPPTLRGEKPRQSQAQEPVNSPQRAPSAPHAWPAVAFVTRAEPHSLGGLGCREGPGQHGGVRRTREVLESPLPCEWVGSSQSVRRPGPEPPLGSSCRPLNSGSGIRDASCGPLPPPAPGLWAAPQALTPAGRPIC